MLNRRHWHSIALVFVALFAILLWLWCMHWFAVSLYEMLDTLRFLLQLSKGT